MTKDIYDPRYVDTRLPKDGPEKSEVDYLREEVEALAARVQDLATKFDALHEKIHGYPAYGK